MSLETKRFYEFGPYRLDIDERVLLRGDEPVQLTPKAFDTLVALIENPGHVLEKEELMKRVWPDTFVEEANLAVNISALRKALGEPPAGGQYIETVPRRGYRFVAGVTQTWADPPGLIVRERTRSRIVVEEISQQVEPLPELETAAARRVEAGRFEVARIEGEAARPAHYLKGRPKRSRAAAAIGLALAVVVGAAVYYLFIRDASRRQPGQPRRLAVLPFQNLKPDSETDFLGFSLADAIITKLGYVSALIVRPSSYVGKYRNQDIDPRQVASELNVDTLLTGNFIKEGDELRITAQLIDATRGVILWKLPIDLKYERLLTVQDKVSQQIIQGLQLNLSPAEHARLASNAPDNPQAYELFLRGVDLYQTNRFTSALKMLEQSVELNPNYALAWAHLGRAYSANAAFQFGGQAHYKKAQEYYEHALGINPEQIEAHIFMANLFTDTGRADKSVLLLREAIATNPNLAEAHWELGYAYRFGGMLEESIEECERARRLDPEVKLYSSALNSYLYAGQYDKFIQSLPERDIAYIVFYRGLANYYLKNFAQAAADFDRAYELSADFYTRIGKALSYGIAGQKEKGIELLRETRQMIEERGVGDAEGKYKVAQASAVLGDKAAAIRILRQSIEGGFYCYSYFIADPLLENIRSDLEYAPLMEMARARHEDFKLRFF
jgi:DNA-binding winged helix-turn-helix (wHTH) protein/TolB-like protein/Tfp pilus assembly protein PilF